MQFTAHEHALVQPSVLTVGTRKLKHMCRVLLEKQRDFIFGQIFELGNIRECLEKEILEALVYTGCKLIL